MLKSTHSYYSHLISDLLPNSDTFNFFKKTHNYNFFRNYNFFNFLSLVKNDNNENNSTTLDSFVLKFSLSIKPNSRILKIYQIATLGNLLKSNLIKAINVPFNKVKRGKNLIIKFY